VALGAASGPGGPLRSLPAGLVHAGEHASVGELAEGDAGEHELAVHGARAAAHDAAGAQADGRGVAGQLGELLTSSEALLGGRVGLVRELLELSALRRKLADEAFTLLLLVDHALLGH